MRTEEEIKKEFADAEVRQKHLTQQYQNLQRQIQMMRENSDKTALEINGLNEKIKTLNWITAIGGT